MHRPRLGSPLPLYPLLAIAIIAAILPFARVLGDLYNIWNLKPEYSHGVIIPVLSAWLIWRQRAELRHLPFTGSWIGLVMIVAGLSLRYVGELTTMQTIEHYAFLLVIYGLVLALTGPVIFRRLWMPLVILIFAIPLPSLFGNALSLQLQLVSSALGVWVIRSAGISVLLEGNIIDLGFYQLEVAEACSGLRYLLPLMTLAFIVSYVFRGPLWKRLVIFFSSIPITVLMNSLRIGFIGITVERWGTKMAEGALHDFEGWLVFMFSTGALFLTAMVLSKVGKSRTKWADAFDVRFVRGAGGAARTAPIQSQTVPKPFVAAAILVLTGAGLGFAAPVAQLTPPSRTAFEEFPSQIEGWSGQRQTLQSIYLDILRLDDYVLIDYRPTASSAAAASAVPVNFYAAYYKFQDSTRAVHSPHDCIPGGGWEIQKLEKRQLPGVGTRASFPINRAVIQLGSSHQIVYYWFQERGRHFTNEYMVRWYLFWDALTRHRTDGALVRFVAEVPVGATESTIDAQMMALATTVVPRLGRYIPD